MQLCQEPWTTDLANPRSGPIRPMESLAAHPPRNILIETLYSHAFCIRCLAANRVFSGFIRCEAAWWTPSRSTFKPESIPPGWGRKASHAFFRGQNMAGLAEIPRNSRGCWATTWMASLGLAPFVLPVLFFAALASLGPAGEHSVQATERALNKERGQKKLRPSSPEHLHNFTAVNYARTQQLSLLCETACMVHFQCSAPKWSVVSWTAWLDAWCLWLSLLPTQPDPAPFLMAYQISYAPF